MFLLWLLMRRLALGLPTALQLNGTPPLLFHERGVCQFTHPDDQSVSALSLASPHKIWALVDSNELITVPAHIFQVKSFFVVEAVRFSIPLILWMDHSAPRRFFMKPWSFSEVLQAYVDTVPVCHEAHTLCSRPYLGVSGPHTERQLWHLYHKYGASAAALADYAHIPSAYEARIITAVKDLSLNPWALDDTLSLVYELNFYNPAVVIEPSPASRSKPEARIASRLLAEMLQAEQRFQTMLQINQCNYHSLWLR